MVFPEKFLLYSVRDKERTHRQKHGGVKMNELNEKYVRTVGLAGIILGEYGIQYDIHALHGGAQITFDWNEGDGVCHSFSYGNETGNIETYGFPWDNGDVSVLDIPEFCSRVKKLWNEREQKCG